MRNTILGTMALLAAFSASAQETAIG